MWKGFWNTNSIFDDSIWIQLLSVGIIFILTGLLIILVPEILIAFIASIFFLIGGMLTYFAIKLRKESKRSFKIKIDYIE